MVDEEVDCMGMMSKVKLYFNPYLGREKTFFIKVNIDENNTFKTGDVIRMCYVNSIDENHNDIVFVNGVVIDTSDKFITILYLSPNIKYSDKRLPIIEIEGNPYRVTPIVFYVFKDFYRYVDVITTLDKNTVDLLKLVTIEQPMDKLSYRLRRFYKKEIDKYLSIFYDVMIDTILTLPIP
jgi:hypothetical protein